MKCLSVPINLHTAPQMKCFAALSGVFFIHFSQRRSVACPWDTKSYQQRGWLKAQATQTKKTLRRTRRRINLAASSKTVSKFKISTNRRKGSQGTISVDLKSLLEWMGKVCSQHQKKKKWNRGEKAIDKGIKDVVERDGDSTVVGITVGIVVGIARVTGKSERQRSHQNCHHGIFACVHMQSNTTNIHLFCPISKTEKV